MCSTCGCGKKADTFEAPKRQRIGNRFISRRKDGTISKNVDVGRSLSADRRTKAKTTASAGQGDKGDLKRAESKFDKLSNEIAKDYEKKGKSKDEAEEIGKATAYKIGVAKYGKRGMERKARAGRAKNAESFGADEKKRSGMKIAPKIQMVNYEDVMTEKMKNQNMKDAEEFDAQYVIVHGEDGRRKAHKTGFEERDGFTPQFIERTRNEQLGDYVPSDSAIDNVAFENHAETFEANAGGLKCNVCQNMVANTDGDKYFVCDTCANDEGMGAESFGADGDGYGGNYNNASWNDSLFDEAQHFFEHMEKASTNALSLMQMGAIERSDYYFYIDEKIANIESRMRSLLGKSGILKKGHMERLNIDAPMEAEDFGADFTTVQRPHHVARVRNDRIDDATGQWVKFPNRPKQYYEYHKQQNMKGKMYDEERGGWVEMDDKARSMFEEIGGKISDFDVVGTTQDVVGKTGFNIPTGVASIAVVFMAYMTGKRYGN